MEREGRKKYWMKKRRKIKNKKIEREEQKIRTGKEAGEEKE